MRCKVYPLSRRGQYNPTMNIPARNIPALNVPALNITVRLAERDDVPVITDFNLAMAAETEDKGLDAEVLAAGVRGVFDCPERAVYRVAEVDGEVVGSLMVTAEWSDWRNGLFWWIQSVFVRPEFRKRGVYRALHEDVCAAARETAGVCGVRLYVERENRDAQAVYEAMGMSATSYRLYEAEFRRGNTARPAAVKQ